MILSKFAVGAVLTMIFVAVPELIAAVIATGGLTRLAEGLFVGALAGSVIYNAVFVMISVLTTRADRGGPALPADLGGAAGQLRRAARGSCPWSQYSLGIANSIASDSNLNAHLGVVTAWSWGRSCHWPCDAGPGRRGGWPRSRSRATRPERHARNAGAGPGTMQPWPGE